jgi:RNA polymerase sigma-70 factor (ECF subfamily)
MTEKLYDESRLLSLLSEGSEYAFTQIFDRYKDGIYSVACKILKSHLMAEEIVQDVFMKIWIKRAELSDINRLDAYLFIIARNLTFDRLKRLAYETTAKTHWFENEKTGDDTDYRIRRHQCERILSEAINQLPARQKRVYLLSKESGLSHEEIALQLQISKLTAKKHLVKSVRSIRKYLSRHLDELIILVFLLCPEKIIHGLVTPFYS